MNGSARPKRILDPGLCLTLRPMAYPTFFEMYRAAIKNTWSVEEVDFSTDVADLTQRMGDPERHLVHRLVAFFATGDSIVANNLVLNLYKHINAPEARMYLSRQLYEEALHVQFYLTLLDTYVPDPEDRARAFDAVENIPSIRRKAEFCNKYLDSVENIGRLETAADRRRFLLNLICLAACIEGLFFFGAFAYEVVRTVREEEPGLVDDQFRADVHAMLDEAIACEVQFAEDLLGGGIAGLSVPEVKRYLEYCADQRLATLGFEKRYGTKNPFSFMALQDVQEVTNFFERRVSAYQTGVTGDVAFDVAF